MLHVNLIYERLLQRQRSELVVKLGIVGCVVLLVAMLGIWWWKDSQVKQVENQIAAAKKEISDKKSDADQARVLKAYMDTFRPFVDKYVKGAEIAQAKWRRVLTALGEAIPMAPGRGQAAKLTGFVTTLAEKGTTLRVQGNAVAPDYVSAYMQALNQLSDIFDPALTRLGTVSSVGQPGEETYSFAIELVLAKAGGGGGAK